MPPDFLGIGAQKCATGWVFRALDAHPGIAMARSADGKKNVHFFGHFFDRGFDWYEAHFAAAGDRIRGEFSTAYLYDRNAPSRVRQYAPEVNLLVSLRHPVERAMSNHKHQVAKGRVPDEKLDFERAIESNPMYLDQGRYFTHLSAWLEHFPVERFHIMLVEEIRTDPQTVVRQLYDAVGADPDYRAPDLARTVHASSGRDAPVRRLVRRALGRGGRPGVEVDLSREARARLLDFFREDNERLASTFGLDLSGWHE